MARLVYLDHGSKIHDQIMIVYLDHYLVVNFRGSMAVTKELFVPEFLLTLARKGTASNSEFVRAICYSEEDISTQILI